MTEKKKTPRQRAGREAPERRRGLILAAARKCLSENGMRAFTLKNIAAEAEVSISLLSHYFGSADELLKAVFKSVMFEVRAGEYTAPKDLSEALENLWGIIDRNFDPDYYSRTNLLVWLPIYEEMLLNARTRRKLDKLDEQAISEVAQAIADVARFRKRDLDAHAVAAEFLAFLDGLWLRWCLSGRRDTERELGSAVRFLEVSLGSLERQRKAARNKA